MFTVVVQKGQKLIVEGEPTQGRGRKGKKKINKSTERSNERSQTRKKKENISTLSAKTVSTGGRRNCCHVYKITNTYEGFT